MTTKAKLSPELKKKITDLNAGRSTWNSNPTPETTIKPKGA